jgi:restriction endonuclease S subunit
MPRVSPKFLKEEVFIPLPPLPIQSRIVARLDSAFANIDEQISLLRTSIADMESVGKSVLEEVFQNTEYDIKKLGEIVTSLSG